MRRKLIIAKRGLVWIVKTHDLPLNLRAIFREISTEPVLGDRKRRDDRIYRVVRNITRKQYFSIGKNLEIEVYKCRCYRTPSNTHNIHYRSSFS